MIAIMMATALAGSAQTPPVRWDGKFSELGCERSVSCIGWEINVKFSYPMRLERPAYSGPIVFTGPINANTKVVQISVDDPKGQGSGCIWEVTAPISHEQVCVVDYEGRAK